MLRKLLVLSACVVAMSLSASAGAAPRHLKGQYGVTGTINCIVSNTPFAANTASNFTPTSFTTSIVANMVGVQTFNADGTATLNVRSVSFTPPPVTNNATNPPTNPLGGIGTNASDGMAQLNYTIDKDGLLSFDLAPGTLLHATSIDGNSTFTIDHHQPSGMISDDMKTLTVGTITPVMETQVITPTNGPQFTHYRVCHRVEVMTWLGDKDDHDH